MDYVELHARSAFSFLAGASLPETLAYACVERQLPAMALLDRNGVYGSARFHLTSKANNVKTQVGAEVSVANGPDTPAPYYPLLVENRQGYQNLCRLVTKTKLRAPKNTPTAATLSELEEHASGLVCLTGDEEGPLAQALSEGGKPQARCLLEQLTSTFGRENVYVELQRHFRPDQECRNHAATELARELKLPLLATNGVLTQPLPIAKCWMSLRVSEASALSTKLVLDSKSIPNGTCAPVRKWQKCFPTCRKRLLIQRSCPRALSSRLRIWAIDSLDTRCLTEEPRWNFCVHRF